MVRRLGWPISGYSQNIHPNDRTEILNESGAKHHNPMLNPCFAY